MAAGKYTGSNKWNDPMQSLTLPIDAVGTPAMDKVLAITELLEAVLDHLPGNDISLARLVSKTWQETIQNSITLHKALWFARKDLAPVEASGKEVDICDMKHPRPTFGMSAVSFLEASQDVDPFFMRPELEAILDAKPNSNLFLIPDIEFNENGDVPQWMHETSLTQPPTSRIVVGWQCRCQYMIDDVDEDEFEEAYCQAGSNGNRFVTIADLWLVLSGLVEDCPWTSVFCFYT